MTTQTVTSAALRAERAALASERARLDQLCRGLALRRAGCDGAAEAEAMRLGSQIDSYDTRIKVLDGAIEQAADLEARERAQREEAAIVALEQQAADEEHALDADRAKLTALTGEVRSLVQQLAVRQTVFVSQLHRIYQRRHIDRTDLARQVQPHRMLGTAAAEMLAEHWLRRALVEARHATRKGEQS